MVEGVIFSVCFCIFFVVTFLVLQASRLEECFKQGKIVHMRIAYFILSFIIAFLITYGFQYLVGLFKF
ncbi:MAG: hypothetical protein K2N65_01910 [Anaeroplasmataceae bacterium]|nr:hypothetical protein [Anaeroplasmataceae bacterium]